MRIAGPGDNMTPPLGKITGLAIFQLSLDRLKIIWPGRPRRPEFRQLGRIIPSEIPKMSE